MTVFLTVTLGVTLCQTLKLLTKAVHDVIRGKYCILMKLSTLRKHGAPLAQWSLDRKVAGSDLTLGRLLCH